MKKLFIIGNGFDLHHGIKCSYDDYKTYLEQHDLNWIVEFFERCFFAIDLPEEYTKIHKGLDACGHDRDKYARTLAENYAFLPTLNTWRFIEVILGCINGIPDDLASDSENFANTITAKISDWMSEELGNITTTPKMILPKEDCTYLTFNYTDTLEKIYNIPSDIVKHIHNKIGEKLIFGHANYEAIQDTMQSISVPYTGDPAIDSVLQNTATTFNTNKYMEKYFKACLKDVNQIAQINKAYFQALAGLKQIYVLGHSLSSVDYVYFNEIDKIAPNAKWFICYYNESSKEDIKETAVFQQIKNKAKFITWRDVGLMFGPWYKRLPYKIIKLFKR